MKVSTLIVLAILFSFNVFASSRCQLDKPINIGGADLFESGLFLEDVVLDQIPRFTEPENYEPRTDKLTLDIFNINWNNSLIGKLGVRVDVYGTLESIGFMPNYVGNFEFKGSKLEKRSSEGNSIVTYTTKTVSRYTEPQHAKKDAVMDAKVVVDGNHLISVELTFPVFRVWKREEYATYIAFTGDHQTLCLKGLR